MWSKHSSWAFFRVVGESHTDACVLDVLLIRNTSQTVLGISVCLLNLVEKHKKEIILFIARKLPTATIGPPPNDFLDSSDATCSALSLLLVSGLDDPQEFLAHPPYLALALS